MKGNPQQLTESTQLRVSLVKTHDTLSAKSAASEHEVQELWMHKRKDRGARMEETDI